MVVLVTGASGQVGQALQKASQFVVGIRFVFTDSKTLNITNLENCKSIFKEFKPDFCINCAAYTAVDKAESETDLAYQINVVAVKNLAESCKEYQTTLIHLSTDFVFDGEKTTPYTETDFPNPKNVYGKTKLEAEQVIQAILENFYIIRTSWVYSEFGNNFYKTMLRLASERGFLNVVNDQIGTPTNANCLAKVIIHLIQYSASSTRPSYGIYHFSNEGICSWYDFANEIFKLNNIQTILNPVPTSSFPTPAIRPKFSVLDKSKIKTTFGIKIKSWKDALKDTTFEN